MRIHAEEGRGLCERRVLRSNVRIVARGGNSYIAEMQEGRKNLEHLSLRLLTDANGRKCIHRGLELSRIIHALDGKMLFATLMQIVIVGGLANPELRPELIWCASTELVENVVVALDLGLVH